MKLKMQGHNPGLGLGPAVLGVRKEGKVRESQHQEGGKESQKIGVSVFHTPSQPFSPTSSEFISLS